MKNFLWMFIALTLICSPVFAGPGEGESPVKKVGNEIANAVTDELVGKETVKTTTETTTTAPMNLPPGLAKKGKVPPGWAKKRAIQTREEVTEQKPSLIQKWVNIIFRKADQTAEKKVQGTDSK